MKNTAKTRAFKSAAILGAGAAALFLFQNMSPVAPPGMSYVQLGYPLAPGKLCSFRPTAAGAPYYNAILNQRAAKTGLKDVEVMSHVATRLGFGLSPLGALVPNNASDCTTVFFAEELARQINIVGTGVDTAHVNAIRRGLLPLSMYSRMDLDKAITRFQKDSAAAAQNVHGNFWWKARQEVTQLMTLREILGSQVIVSGVVQDHQMNLEERLHEFWFNHFNVDGSKAEQYHIGKDSIVEVTRLQIGGTFYGLLSAVMRHPAMLVYLDNHDNRYVCTGAVCAASNQNLGRELMELHTFGLPPRSASFPSSPYTQTDIEAMSKILAGWNVISYTHPTAPGQFVYNTTLAANVPVSLLGVSYANTGVNRMPAVLSMLANHAQTKENICLKLAKNLFAPALVTTGKNACKAAWGTNGNLKAMYAAMVRLPAFWSLANYRSLYRTPIEIPVAAARAIGMNIADFYRQVVDHKLTHTPYNPATVTPNGFMAEYTRLKATPVWWTFFTIGNEIRNLLGVYRGEISLPIGYNDLGSEHLSSSYIDAASRVAFGMTDLTEGMSKTTPRLDKVTNQIRTQLKQNMITNGNVMAQHSYIQSTLNLGSIVRYASYDPVRMPYELPLSQQAIITAVVANKSAWPINPDWPNVLPVDKGIACLALGNAQQMKK